jgi:hypothetical protein
MGAFRCSFSRLIRVVFAQGATVPVISMLAKAHRESFWGSPQPQYSSRSTKVRNKAPIFLANLILAAAEEGIYWFEIYRTGISWH